MGFLDALGDILSEAVNSVEKEQNLTAELSGKSDKRLMEEAYELQGYFAACDAEDKNSQEYKDNQHRLQVIEHILQTRGYFPMKVYVPTDVDELDELGEFFSNFFN